MRFGAALVVCAGLSLTVAGCDQADRVFFKKGIGTELNSGDIEATTKAQDAYVADICRQAGFTPVSDTMDPTVVSCGPRPNDPATWQLFVQAGMNDIDQRCDAYLSWLDYVRRSKEPTLTQLAQASTTTTVILDRAGVGAGPIAIVAAAFGFAIQTFTNVTSRLILEVNHSTVQAVVLSHQKEFREDLFGSVDKRLSPVVIGSKPAAIYALRSYLRLCMPMTIETQINNVMTTFSRGGTRALEAGEPMITAATVGVRPTIIRDVNVQMGRPGGTVVFSETRLGKFEQATSGKDFKMYLDILGCSGTDLGIAGSPARRTLTKFLTDNAKRPSDRLTPDVGITLRELRFDGKKSICSG